MERYWLSAVETAERANCHHVTVLKAVEAGELHGIQRKKYARWKFRPACVDAWLAGERCEHQAAEAAAS